MFKQINPDELQAEAIDFFFNEAEKIKKVHRLLLRGSGSHLTATRGWSDLDFSVILHEINYDRLCEIRNLYRQLIDLFPDKVSITVVSTQDFLSPLHHHGTKPIYYSNTLEGRPLFELKTHFISLEKALKLDCTTNLAYLIHDLRRRFIVFNDKEDIRTFVLHLLRRTRHMIRDSMYILTGKEVEDIKSADFQKIFPLMDSSFLNVLTETKIDWPTISTNSEKIEHLIIRAYSFIESFYEHLIPSMNQLWLP
ncbi:MAG: hypothetical protein KDK55_04005 [Chlamydiia bacterium]|nr:hypothetical protein [Chlamydiia bacterium]